jgi:hypothetical protein
MTKRRFERDKKQIYDEVFDCMAELIHDGYSEQLVASTMMAIAMRLYKSVLKPNDFLEMIESVKRTSKTVKPFYDGRTIN